MAEPSKPHSKSATSPPKSPTEAKSDDKPKPTSPTTTSSSSSSSTGKNASTTPPAVTSDLKKEPFKNDDDVSATDDDDKKLINMEVFNQILELDDEDDETKEFSRQMVEDYFQQAMTTFGEMDRALSSKDLSELSSLGHFLKGSSAALGVQLVMNLCTDIQHYGQKRDEDSNRDLSPKEALDLITKRIVEVKHEFNRAEKWFLEWYQKDGIKLDVPSAR